MTSLRGFAAIVTLLTAADTARADDPDPVVVRVGSLALHASDVAGRLSKVPAFQLRTLGDTPPQIRKRFVDTVLVPELLYASEADRLHLDAAPSVRGRLRESLRRALAESIRRDALSSGIPGDEVRTYYDAHPDDFRKPERIRIWRILVEDEALARRIIDDAKGPSGPDHWSRLARESSVDAATKMRDGLLGFVRPDGTTDVPQVQVDPALYAAAAKVRDGELVPAPVREQNRFAVVWRRGTLPEINRSLESAHDVIRDLLLRQRVEHTVIAMREDLRRREVKDENPDLLAALPPETPGAQVRPRSHGTGSPSNPAPTQTERGLR